MYIHFSCTVFYLLFYLFIFLLISIEWIAYDLHSGLHSLFWKLFDNFTGENIIHGHEDIPAQGHTKVCECIFRFSILR